jgi:hypothetical protein
MFRPCQGSPAALERSSQLSVTPRSRATTQAQDVVQLAALLLLGGLVDQGLVNVRDDTTASDGGLHSQDTSEQCNSLDVFRATNHE